MRLLAGSLGFLCVAFVAVRPAAANDSATAIIDRTLSLDPSTLQLAASAALVHVGNTVDPAPTNIESLEFGADFGIMKHLQAGAVVDIAVSPSSEFDRGLLSGQYQLLEFAAFRLDLGAQRAVTGLGFGTGLGDLEFAFGVGVPLRLKLTETLALISSRPFAFGAEDDLFSVRAGSGKTITEYRVPLGILYQLDKHFALSGRTGYRSVDTASFVPFGADLTLTVGFVDFGVSFDLAGQVGPDDGPGYFDLLALRGFLQIRI
jgi:hypothetical protein